MDLPMEFLELRRRAQRLPLLLAALACLLGASCNRSASAPIGSGPHPTNDLFSSTSIVRIDIQIPHRGIKQLGRAQWNPGNGKDRPEVKAVVKEGDAIYADVAVHLKGAAGSFRPVDDRPALTLNFDKFNKGQTFHGLKKLSLNNSVQDPTLMNEKICREMFAKAGVPVPRSDYAIVSLNGRPLGIYVLVEGYNKQFLKRHFDDVSGNLYDGGFLQDISENMGVNSGDNQDDRSDVRRLAAAAERARQSNRLDELAQVLDLDRFLTLAALEVIQCHWDGYAMKANNYRLFHSRDSGHMIFMPHGLDQMFGIGDQPDVHGPILPHMGALVSSAVVSTKEGRTRYLARFAELRTNVFDVVAITNRIRELQSRLRPALAEFGANEVANHSRAIDRLCRNIAARAASIDEQLAAPSNELDFTLPGGAKIAGWRPRNGGADSGGRVQMGGRKAIHIKGSSDTYGTSWRTRVHVPQGRYRLEGMVSTKGVARNGDSGATLRISGSQSRQMVQGEAEWSAVSFPFEVREPFGEVELICELKGNRGEAWFDLDSLKLRRLE